MRTRVLHPAASLALTAALAAPTALAAELIDATEPPRVLAIAQTYGDAALTTDGMGDPLIKGTLDGQGYVIDFYDCTKRRDCTTVTFQAVWETDKVSKAKMAKWNRTERFGKAYLDEDGYPTVEMNVNLRGGVSAANLNDTFDWWRLVLERFVDRYDL
jgi:hypothetical protein